MKTPKLSIAICGSAGGEQRKDVHARMEILGKEFARQDIALFTGAGKGYPHTAAKACVDAGGLSIGVSPAVSLIDHRDNFGYPLDGFSTMFYSGFGIKGRNTLLVGTCSAVICVGGGIGTLNEFTIAYDEGKPVGILADSGGLSSDFKPLSQKAYEKRRHTKIVIEEHDPIILLEKTMSYIKQ